MSKYIVDKKFVIFALAIVLSGTMCNAVPSARTLVTMVWPLTQTYISFPAQFPWAPAWPSELLFSFYSEFGSSGFIFK